MYIRRTVHTLLDMKLKPLVPMVLFSPGKRKSKATKKREETILYKAIEQREVGNLSH